MLVYSSGLVPGARQAIMEYEWIDLKGRPTSPPLNHSKRGERSNGHRTVGNIRLLQEENERRVCLLFGSMLPISKQQP